MPEDNEINLEQDLEDGILKAVGQTEKKPSKKLSDDDLDENEKKVLVHSSLDDAVVGQVIELKEDFAKTRFRATKDMTYDPEGLVFNAFVYTAASWAAQLAINKEFLITASSKCNFLSPIKVGDMVISDATVEWDLDLIAIGFERGFVSSIGKVRMEADKWLCEELNKVISSHLKGYTLERIFKIDLAILKLAIYEIEYMKEKPAVVINEAVELSKRYSTDNSYKFINGVLANIVKGE